LPSSEVFKAMAAQIGAMYKTPENLA